MNKKSKTLLKNMGLFTIGSFGSKILTFLLVPLYTAMLSTSDYGTVDLMTSTASLLTPILLLSIFDATLRFGMDPNYKKEDVISTSINITIKGSLVLIIGATIAGATNLFKISKVYYVFLCTYFILGSIGHIFNLYMKAKNKASIIAVSGILCTLITCTSNILLLVYFKLGIAGYMIGNTVGVLIQNAYIFFVGKLYKDIKLKNYNDLKKPMVTYSFPLIANSISWWVNNASDRYVLTYIKGIAENGIYSISYKIPTIISVFQGIFYNAWSISAISEFDEKDTDGFIGNNYTLFSFISIIISSGLLLMNIPLAKILYRGDYYIAWKCVPFLVIGTAFSGISQLEGSLYAATKKTKMVARTSIIGASINLICNFLFIYYIGAVGAALATLIGYFVTWMLRTIYLQSFIKMKVKWISHFFSIAIVIVQAICATIGIYYIQILLTIVLLLINLDIIKPILNKFFKYLIDLIVKEKGTI